MRQLIGRAWFRRRSVGVGWQPATWQGWVITAVAVAGVTAVLASMRHSAARIPIVVLIICAYALVAVVAARTRADDPGSGGTSAGVGSSTGDPHDGEHPGTGARLDG
jgi:hypothetical protein